MPTYEVTAPDGKTYQIDGPPNAPQRDIVNALLSKYPESATPFKPDTGLVSAFTSSARAGLGSAAEGAGEFAGLPGLAEFGKQQQATAARSFAPVSDEDVAAADKRGLIAGATTRASRLLEPFAQGAGSILGRYGLPLAAGTVSAVLPEAAAAAPFLGGTLDAIGLGTVGRAVATGAVAVADAPLETGELKVAREKAGLPPNPTADLIGGIASAAWLAVSPGLLTAPIKGPMAALLGKSAVQQAEMLAPKVLAGELTAAEASTQVSGYLTNAIKGTIENAAVGSGMMVGSTAITRGALGQDLTSPEAMEKYGEAIKGAVGLSPMFGLAHGIGAKGEAVAKLKENEAERTAALSDINTQKAEQAQTLRERDLAQAELEKQKPEYAEKIMDQYRAAEQEKLDLINQKRTVESGSVTETADRLHNENINDQVKALQPNIEALAAEYNKYYKTPQAAEAVETPAATTQPTPGLVAPEPTEPRAMEPVDTTGLDKTSDYVTSLTNDLNLTAQQMDAIKGTNLLGMVGKLRLNKNDWADIGSLPTFARGKGGGGVPISDRVADGLFDRWLPFNLRSEIIEGNLDKQLEAEEYIKEAFRQHGLGKPFYDYETRMALAEHENQISDLEKEIDRENNLEAVNGEIQSIADELAAEEHGNREPSEFGAEPEGATSGAAEGEREAAPEKLTSPEEKQLSSTEPEAAPEVPLKPIDTSKLQAVLTKALLPALQRFGLKDIGLKLIENAGDYEGQYTQKLISIALDAAKPLQALRHEAIHALKDMGFFTEGQWALLEKQADKVWIDKYLKERNVDGKPIKEGGESRFDAYMKLYKGNMEAIREEAIADAFADFDANGAPKGIMSTLLEKMRNFFAKVKDALTGNGYTTAEDVFKQIESGGLKATREAGGAAKPSLRSSSYGLNVLNGAETAPDFGKKPLVDDVAKHFDDQVMKKFGKKLDYNNPKDMAAAIKMASEEVAHQMKSEQSGLDWYDDDIKKAFADTAKVIPSLNSEPKRQLFSIMAGILSPQINSRDNWFIAAKAFEHYEKTGDIPGVNPDTGGLWQGGTQSANKKKAMDFLNNMVKAMGESKTLDWLQSNHTVKEINDFRKNYGGMSSGIDGKAGDIRPGLYAFGPKVGPFVSNINGIHDVTVDKWATRTFNRYFGTMTDSDGKVIDAPTEPQRRAVKALMNEVASNADIKNYQVQSLLWFYEQKLFRKFGTDSPSYGFSQGAEKLLSQRGIRSGDEGVGAAEAAQAKPSLRTAPDTPEFKQWFGDSKIVDADGKPKVMYHGTARDITAFKPKQAGAIFLTENPYFADTFSGMSAEWMGKHADQFLTEKQMKEGKARAIAAVRKDYGTKIDGKYIIDNIKANVYKDTAPEGQEYLRKAYKEMMPSGQNIMPVYVRAEKPFDYANPDHVRAIEAESPYGLPVNEIITGKWETLETRKIQELIKAAGFDSFYVREGKEKNLAVYDPAQIKSATGNEGTYDINNPDIRKSLRKVQSTIENMPNGANILDALNKRTTAREEKGYAERLIGGLGPEPFSYLRQKFIYQYNQLSVYGKRIAAQMGGIERLADISAEAAALESDRAAGYTASALGVGNRMGGIPKYENGFTIISNEGGSIKGAVEIFAPLAKYADPKIYQAYQFWAMAKRGERLTAEGREKFTPDELAYAKQLEKEFPEFVDIQKDWIKYNDGLVKYMVDTGVLSKEMGAEWTKHSDYIPFYRQLEGEKTIGPKIMQNLTGVKPPKKLKGSEAPAADFLETITRNTQAAITSGLKNVAAQKALDEALFLGEAEKVENAPSAPNIVSVLRDGKVESYRCADPLFLDAVRSLNLPELPGLSFISKPADVLRSMVTKDPAFIIANMMKHSLYTYATSGADISPITGTLKNFTDVMRNKSPEYQNLLNAGVIGGYEFSRNIEASAEAVARDLRQKTGTQEGMEKNLKPITGIWQYLEHATEAHDAAVRISVYKDVLAKTGNEAEALFRANEVLNFNRKGNSALVRVITAGIPFLNAKVQGLDLMYRGLIQPSLGGDVTARQRQVQKTALIRAGTMVGLSVMYAALVTNNPDYEAQQQEVKDNNWIIPGLGVRIPIPFEIGTLFKTMPEHIYRYFYGKEDLKQLQDAGKKALGDALTFTPIPQIALPIVEAESNYSYFTGRPIVGTHMQGIDPKFQVEPNTSIIAKELGQITGMSPLLIDHIYQGYTGTMGMYFSDLMDAAFGMAGSTSKPTMRLEQTPVIKRFLIDNQATGQVSQFYELKDSVETAVKTINDLKSSGSPELMSYAQEHAKEYAARGSVEQIAKQIQALKKQALVIRAMDISADEKRDRLLENVKAQNATVASIGRIKEYLAQ